MRVDRDELPRQGVELVSEWIDRWRRGDRATLDWLTTRTFLAELGVDGPDAGRLGRGRFVEYALALSRGLDWRWDADRIEQREHVVHVDASIEAVHDGVLDLRGFDRARYAATGRRLELPRQRFVWDIVHGRIHRFEVERGPGIGPGTVVDRLDLGEADRLEAQEVSVPRQPDLSISAPGGALASAPSSPSRGRPTPLGNRAPAWNPTAGGELAVETGSDVPRTARAEADTTEAGETVETPDTRETDPIHDRVDRLVERHQRRRLRERVWERATGADG